MSFYEHLRIAVRYTFAFGGGHLSSLSLTQVARCCTATEKPL